MSRMPRAKTHLIFAGEFEHRIDPQGRISVPARFRPAFEDGIVLSKAFDHCVNVYTHAEWEQVAAEMAAIPTNRGISRRLNRLTFAGAYPSQLDRSGRVLIPPQLREYAGLGENIVLVGAGSLMEIWDRSAWEQESEIIDAQAAEIAEASIGSSQTGGSGG
jgi:MraZ protein